MKVLFRESPEGLDEFPATQKTFDRFDLDEDQVAAMNEGETIWDGDIAYTIEEEPE